LRSISAYSAQGVFLGSISLSYPDQVEDRLTDLQGTSKGLEITVAIKEVPHFTIRFERSAPKKEMASADFGVSGAYNKSNSAKLIPLLTTILTIMESSHSRNLQSNSVIHYLDTKTGLNVIQAPPEN